MSEQTTYVFDASESQCAALVAQALDLDPGVLRVSPIPTGKFNTTFRVEGRQAAYILRVAPPDDAGFLFYERGMMAQEPWLHEMIRSRTDVPVAEILAYDDSRALIDRDFLVMECLPGLTLSEAGLDAEQTQTALRDVGRHLAKIHAIWGDAHGYLGPHKCMAPCSTWGEAFGVMWTALLEDLESCGGYDAQERAVFQAAFDQQAVLFDHPVRPSLLHMDVWAQNILVDDSGKMTGLVDFDRALFGDPEIEFAVLDYCGISEPAFWDGYGAPRPEGRDVELRGVFYYLYEVQKYIVIERLRRDNPDRAEIYKQQVMQIFDSTLGRL